MSKPLQVRLTAEDRKALESMVRGGINRVRVIKRAQILLMADVDGPKPRKQGEIVAALGTSVTTVSATGRRYAQQGLVAALGEKPRAGREPKLTGEVEAQLVVLACSDPPEGQVRWTLRLLAGELVRLEHVASISHTAVGNALKKTQ
jgi:putative transposase